MGMREQSEKGRPKRVEGRAEIQTTERWRKRTRGENRSGFYGGTLHLPYSFLFLVSLFTFLPFLDRISTSASPTFDFRKRHLCRGNCRCISNDLVTIVLLDQQRALSAPELLRKPWKFHSKERERKSVGKRTGARWKLTRSPLEVTPMRSGFSSPISRDNFRCSV